MLYPLLRNLCLCSMLQAVLLSGNCWAEVVKGEEQSISFAVPYAGRSGWGTFVWHNFPLTRLYPDFTPAEKANFHSWYEDIAPGDEPPYPTVNMETIARRFSEKLGRYPISGKVELLLQIDAEGKVKSFTIVGRSSPEIADFNMLLLREVRFKPAKCNGKPCAMDFPWFYSIKFSGLSFYEE